jgi:hypothetical protein
MKTYILPIVVFFFFLLTKLNAQDLENINIDSVNISIQRVLFKDQDRDIKFTRYIEDSGEISFIEGFSIPKVFIDSTLLTHFSKSNIEESSYLKITHYHYNENIDTLENYFHAQGGIEFHSCEILKEMMIASYVLKESGLVDSFSLNEHNQILLILPLEEFDRKSYKLMSLKLTDDQLNLKTVTLISNGFDGFIKRSDEKTISNMRKIRKLNSLLLKISGTNNIYCFRDDNPWVLHLSTFPEVKHFFFSIYCTRDNKELRPVRNLFLRVAQWGS